MELTKSQKSLLALSSRWPPIMLGITLSLFVSAIFTFNFASRIRPVSFSAPGSPPSASFLLGTPTPASNTPSFPSQLFIILFRKVYSHGARTDESTSSHSTSPSPKTPVQSSSKVHDGNAEASKNVELVQYNESLPSQGAPSGSSLGRNDPSRNSMHLVNGTDNTRHTTVSLNHTGSEKSSLEELRNNAINASLPDSNNRSEPFRDANSSLPFSPGDSESPLRNAISSINHTRDQPPSSPQEITIGAKVCDISVGMWVEDNSYPLYSPGSCPFVDEAFSCQRNGRPDSKYNRRRWAPRDCIVPRFNGRDLLERLRGKRLVFVGDSLSRNQWESMLCMLRESLSDKRRILQIHGGRISKLPGAYVFKFLDYECKVEFYTSQYLVDKQEGINETEFTIRLDRMDKSERRWRKANVLVFNTGHWWTPDKIGDGDNRFQEGSTVYPKLDVMVAYNKALSTWAKWVDTFVNLQNTSVFFRGYSPVHYIGGQWNSGGQCQDETEPIFDESFLTSYPSRMQALEGVLHEMKLPVQLLNITRLSDFRKDAHPATYGHAPDHVVQHQDCSHWCLPGVPDTWNELLYFALTKQSFTKP